MVLKILEIINLTQNSNIYQFIKSLAERERVSEERIKEIIVEAFRRSYCKEENSRAELSFEFNAGLSVYRLYQIVEEVKDPEIEIAQNDKLLKKGKIKDNKLFLSLDIKNFSLSLSNEIRNQLLGDLGVIGQGRQYKIFKPLEGQKFVFLVKEVKEKVEKNMPQIILTRQDNLFIQKVLEQEIPQIKRNIVAVRHILRFPGLVSKVVVERGQVAVEKGLDIDPSGTCIGERGERAKSVSRLTYPERIEMVDITILQEKKSLVLENRGNILKEIGKYLGKTIHVRDLEERIRRKRTLTNMKKYESSDLLRQIIHRKITSAKNESKGKCLYLWSENINAKKGKAVSLNQLLPFEWLAEFCQSIRIGLKRKDKIDFREVIHEYLKKVVDSSQLAERPPIVSIMGHIDHGKTTLLDTICQTALQKREAGGITQKVTISQSEFQGKKITFLDTPGHSDFIKMRERGVSLTDLVVLVIDGKDGVMPQTKEIIKYLCQYELPVIVFINHKKPHETDNEPNLNRIKDPTHGIVIDAYFHPQTGSRVTELLIQEKIKILLDTQGKKITAASPGDIIKVIGLTSNAELGERFLVVRDEKTQETIQKELVGYSEKGSKPLPASFLQEKKNINLVLISDSQNKLNALHELVKKKNADETAEVFFSVVHATIGTLNNYALDLVKITQSTVLMFGLTPNQSQMKTFKENNIPFFASKVIYEIETKLEKLIGNQQVVEEIEEVVGQARIVKVFEFSKGNIAGCQVVNGKINRNNRVHVYRGKEPQPVFSGEIKGLESQSEKKSEVIGGQECGVVLKGFDDFQRKESLYKQEVAQILYQLSLKNNLPFFSVSYCLLSARGENLKVYLISPHLEVNKEKTLKLLNKEYLTLIKKEIAKIIVKPKKKIFSDSEKDVARFIDNLALEKVLEIKEAALVKSALNFDEIEVASILIP
ncbi:1305_t:CDS:10 [Funneliformis geosporum]|uniref:1305_t:CDS:1 n=1 Tax=Funneliformis geosporum TaxID=1117311 RepID=A0A9W4WP93_9GLOM|nr:1305_t:CDS:10 [Funneliformis geosporum]